MRLWRFSVNAFFNVGLREFKALGRKKIKRWDVERCEHAAEE
jgi:hypothetical protein